MSCNSKRKDAGKNINFQIRREKIECESVCNELEECEKRENEKRGMIWANHYRERNDYTNLAELCKLGDIVAMYDMAQFFYNLCSKEQQQIIKNYEMNPCEITENKLRESMNYSKKDKFEPENNMMGYYMMWLVRAAMYGNEKAIRHIEKCGCYKRKASITYDFYLGNQSCLDFPMSNFLSDGGFSDVLLARHDCTFSRYGNFYKLTYLSYYDSADSDGYGSESEYSSVYYDEFFMRLNYGDEKESENKISVTSDGLLKEILSRAQKRKSAIEENERIREKYWENQKNCDERKYKIRLKNNTEK